MNAIWDALIRFGARYDRPIAIVGIAWFALSCAQWIPGLPIPEIPVLIEPLSPVYAGLWNAVWWGLVHPSLERRRKEIAAGERPDE